MKSVCIVQTGWKIGGCGELRNRKVYIFVRSDQSVSLSVTANQYICLLQLIKLICYSFHWDTYLLQLSLRHIFISFGYFAAGNQVFVKNYHCVPCICYQSGLFITDVRRLSVLKYLHTDKCRRVFRVRRDAVSTRWWVRILQWRGRYLQWRDVCQ